MKRRICVYAGILLRAAIRVIFPNTKAHVYRRRRHIFIFHWCQLKTPWFCVKKNCGVEILLFMINDSFAFLQ